MIPLSIMVRRRFLQVNALGTLAATDLLNPSSARAANAPRPRADCCILVYLYGGPSQLETFDPKPNALAEIRGEFGITQTSVPGVVIGDRLPRLARSLRHYTIIRTCQTGSGFSHHGGLYESHTGYEHPSKNLTTLPTIKTGDHPSFTSVVGKLAPGPRHALRCVQFPTYVRDGADTGPILPGQTAGFLGPRHNPFVVSGNPNDLNYGVPVLNLPREIPHIRLDERRRLLDAMNRQPQTLNESISAQNLNVYQEHAVRLLSAGGLKESFDLHREPVHVRNWYGRSIIGQSCLLARRLAEAGVKMITVNPYLQTWDTHGKNFESLENLIPPFDQALAALLEDLAHRGLAERTLVLAVGEFGRTPRINREVGRDHWGNCYSAVVAGAGVRGGQVIGESDRSAGYPKHGRIVTPADMCATVYQAMGIDPEQEIHDPDGRPLRLTLGRPVSELY